MDTYTLTTDEHDALQDGLLQLLIEFDRVCRRLDIPYQLGAGSLLGAVRHQGIIPWDDDADVCMLREHYDRFLREAPRELQSDFYLQHTGSEPAHPFFFAKLRLEATVLGCPFTERLGIHQGIYLDIFPFDDVRPNRWPGRFHMALVSKICRELTALAVHPEQHLAVSRSFSGQLLVRGLDRLMRMVGKNRLHAVTVWLAACYSRFSKVGGDEQRWVTCLISSPADPVLRQKRVRTLGAFVRTSLMPFCGHSFPVPQNYDEVLTNLYGDYRQLPALEYRRPQHPITRFRFDRPRGQGLRATSSGVGSLDGASDP